VSALTVVVLLAQLATAAEVERAVSAGIHAGVFPGAVVVLGVRDSILLARGYGHLTWSPKSRVPDPDSTLYDLASLTKVVATTPSIMLLVERGLVQLDRPVQSYLPDFVGTGKEEVLVRHLLAHNSGLRSFIRLDTLARDSAAARQLVMRELLRWKPGTRVEYSDLNAMLLGWIVERVSGMRLDRFAAANIFGPLGMEETIFLPARSLQYRIAPTNYWHGASIAGSANDQNAARLGGVAGHAGLFSTGKEVARYAQLYLRGGLTAAGKRVLLAKTVALFTTRAFQSRALGWEARDTTRAENSGTLMSGAAYGHTGFTGTSLWIDPDNGVFAVVLTNRVYAPRSRRSITRLKQIRGEIADAAVLAGRDSCDKARASGSGTQSHASSKC
jgi:CubicO group peptidase (beta-lactamase class C family)